MAPYVFAESELRKLQEMYRWYTQKKGESGKPTRRNPRPPGDNPSDSIFRAKVLEDAGTGWTIHANLYGSDGLEITTGTSGVDYNLMVHCTIAGNPFGNLSDCQPLLKQDDDIYIQQFYDSDERATFWASVDIFHAAGGGARLAILKADASTGDTLTVNLHDAEGNEITTGTSGVDYNILVSCFFGGQSGLSSANLNECVPRLFASDYIWVQQVAGYWYALTIFQALHMDMFDFEEGRVILKLKTDGGLSSDENGLFVVATDFLDECV